MPLRIYDEQGSARSRWEDEGFERQYNSWATRVGVYQGQRWNRDCILARDVGVTERVKLFFTAGFSKIMIALGVYESNTDDARKTKEDWNAVFSGRMYVAIYIPATRYHPMPAVVAVDNIARFVFRGAAAEDLIVPTNTPAPEPVQIELTEEESQLKETVDRQNDQYQGDMREFNSKLQRWMQAQGAIRPVIVPLEAGFAIAIPAAAHQNVISCQLQARLEQKLTDNRVSYERVQNLSVVKYHISLDEMNNLLSAIPELQLDRDDEVVARQRFIDYGRTAFARHALTSKRDDIDVAISLTLANLNPSLRAVVESIDENSSMPTFLMPSIDIDSTGMTIRTPEGQELIAQRVDHVHGYRFEIEDVVVSGRQYSQKLFIPRDNIKAFLEKIGLNILSIDGYDTTYFRALVNAGYIHEYQPVISDNALNSISRSLSAIVPNVRLNLETFQEEPFIPYVAFHPKGWLSIRMPAKPATQPEMSANGALDAHFFEGLKEFLNLPEAFSAHFIKDGFTYDREFRIDRRELPKFLKSLGLENAVEIPAESSYQPYTLGRDINDISRSIASLHPDVKRQLERNENISTLYPKYIRHFDGRVSIEIPQTLNTMRMEIAPGHTVSFGEYLTHSFGLNGELIANKYCIKLSVSELKTFLERDLSLREVNLGWYRGVSSYTQILCSATGVQVNGSSNRLEIVGWRLRNPTVPLPANIPNLTDDQIVARARRLLANSPFCDQYCRVIEQTLAWKNQLPTGTARVMENYLRLIVCPVDGLVLTDMQRSAALATIGATATACMPGRVTKIEEEYKYLVRPESRDQIRTLLLDEVERYKAGLLPALFADVAPCMHVHTFAAAHLYWGAELGLDVEAGRRDGNVGCGTTYTTEEKKREFKALCQQHMVTHIYEILSQTFDEDQNLEHLDLYTERLTRVLRNEGYNLDEIEGLDEHPVSCLPTGGLLDQYLPCDNNGKKSLSLAGLQAMLIDIGVLRG